MILEPDFIVADEPESMLDVSVRAGILNLLREVRDAMGLAAIYISHDVTLDRYVCAGTLVMYRGRIVEDGPTDDVIRAPRHPYTKALISSVPVPRVEQNRCGRLATCHRTGPRAVCFATAVRSPSRGAPRRRLCYVPERRCTGLPAIRSERMPAPKRLVKLTAFCHPPGHWRMPGAAPTDMDFAEVAHIAQIAERGLFDMIFFQDSAAVAPAFYLPGGGAEALAEAARCVRLEPLTMLAALATVTTRIGLIATATTTYNDPFNIARKFATIDHISKGRAGWNLVTSQNVDEARNFSRDAHLDHALRYERAEEFHDVVTGLWDSWEDDAVIRDRASGRYIDPSKLHVLGHKGKHYSVHGPLNIARPPHRWKKRKRFTMT